MPHRSAETGPPSLGLPIGDHPAGDPHPRGADPAAPGVAPPGYWKVIGNEGEIVPTPVGFVGSPTTKPA